MTHYLREAAEVAAAIQYPNPFAHPRGRRERKRNRDAVRNRAAFIRGYLAAFMFGPTYYGTYHRTDYE